MTDFYSAVSVFTSRLTGTSTQELEEALSGMTAEYNSVVRNKTCFPNSVFDCKRVDDVLSTLKPK